MADFRKWFLVLAALALVVGSASAQITCTTNPAQPPTIRDGGLAELVGDVVLVCSGIPPAGTPNAANVTASIQVSMNPATVSNRVKAGNTATECPTSIPCVTDALVFVTDELGNIRQMPTGQTTPNYGGPIVGLLQSNGVADSPTARNAILFPNITIPYGTTTLIRIANIRVVAPPASNTAQVAQVFENLSTLPFGAWSITNPTQTVAQVLPPLQFSVRACDDGAAAVANFRQCISQDKAATTFNVKYTEGFQFAFKMRGDGTQCNLGTSYFSESGYTFPSTAANCPTWASITPQAVGGTTPPNLPNNPTSLADSGTKLIIKFSNIPAGVSIWVSNTQTFKGTSGTGTTAATFTPWITAALDNPGSTNTTATCAKSGEANTVYNVPISGGVGSAQWSITGIVQGVAVAQKSISFAVVVSYAADTTHGLPGLTGSTPGSVAGEIGPVSNPPANFASTGAAIPRFVDNPFTGSAFTIVPCVSTLLYPFVTNKAGFDTGIAIVNTSLDNAGGGQPYNTPTQHGTCTVYYFDGTTSAPAPQVTPDIVPGGMSAFSLQTGGVPNSTSSAQGFQGYVIAKCNFQFAHGYAYIVDRQSSLGSQGYLALVIPDMGQTARTPDPFTATNLGSGEQLTN